MLYSMTGYGKAVSRDKKRTIEAEIQSVNGKFATVNVNLPRFLASFEFKVKELVKRSQARGSIYVNLTWDENAPLASVDANRYAEYYRFLKGLQKRFKLSGEITLDHLLKVSAPEAGRRRVSATRDWPRIKKVLDKALAAWQASRKREGKRLQQYFNRELGTIRRLTRQLVRADARRIRAKKAALAAKVRRLLPDDLRARLPVAEIAAEVQKIDITEELERLQSHTELFSTTVNSSASEGKKLGFILQEMQREVNTLSVKSGSVRFVRWAVALKEAIERLKEQIQNIE